ncbi:unnamed protein product [Rotaria sp. Silwood1]|nr:unnamed protein product [Rotaria sp. Silwood1]CAF1587350.1 unnamed protein product [Rotaria sp. Silwood1]
MNNTTIGYKNLHIDIYCLSSSLTFFFEIVDEKVIDTKEFREFEKNCIVSSLNQWIPTTTIDFEYFMSNLETENSYKPLGDQLLTYTLQEEESSPYFIDYQNWFIYLLYQQYQNDNNQICYAPIGFTKVYLHYTYSNKKRPKISQMLILPPYQRKGHGRRLLKSIYNDLRNDSRVQDITGIRNFSKRKGQEIISYFKKKDKFIALRDLVSLELCHTYLPDLFSKESINKVNRLTKEMIDKAQEQQTRRVYEMYFLRSINQNDDEQMKRFRLIVKQRLFHSIQSNKHPDLQITNLEIRKIYLITQYENVLQHYEYILETFDKHYYN